MTPELLPQPGELTLDEIVGDPLLTSALTERDVIALIARCATAHSLLLVRLVTLRAAPLVTATDTEKLLTVSEVAKRLQFRPPYVYELIRKGALGAVRAGKYVRVPETSLRLWQRQHLQPGGHPT